MTHSILRRVEQVTQRLDHGTSDPRASLEVNKAAAQELKELSIRLIELLPNPALSPDERLERIARVVQDRIPRTDLLVSDLEKLDRLESRLKELVPDDGLSSSERLERLVSSAEKMGTKHGDFVSLLKSLGDARTGQAPETGA